MTRTKVENKETNHQQHHQQQHQQQQQQIEMLREQISTVLDQFGWYQWRLLLLTIFPLITTGYRAMAVVLTFAAPQHRCRVPGLANDTFAIQSEAHRTLVNSSIPMTSVGGDVSYSKCDVYKDRGEAYAANRTLYGDTEPCHSWVYDHTDFEETIITQFNLVCEEKGFRANFNMLGMLGLLAGSSVSGITSDRFGRKKMFFCGLALGLVMTIAMAFPGIPPVLLVYRFLTSFLDILAYMGFFILILEFMGPEKRTMAGMLVVYSWISGPFLVGGLSYVLRDWRWLQVMSGAPFLFCFSYWWLVDESPRWLLSKGRVQEARKVILKVMKVNKIPVPPNSPLAGDTFRTEDPPQSQTDNNDLHINTEQTDITVDMEGEKRTQTDGDRKVQQEANNMSKEETSSETDGDRKTRPQTDKTGEENLTDGKDKNQREQSFLGIFKYPNLIARTGIIFINWSAISTTYYGLTFNVTNLAGDIRLNFFLSFLVELVSASAAWILLDRLGRKRTHCASMLLSGTSCLATIFTVLMGGPELQWLTITLAMVGKLGISAAFAIIYLMTGELFPTVIRNQGLGFSSTVARVSTALAPYIADLSLYIEGSMGMALPMAIFGAMGLSAGLLALCLPETLHRRLPDTILEAAHFTKPQPADEFAMHKKNDGNHPETNP